MVFSPSIRIIFLSFTLGILVLLLFLAFNRPEYTAAYGILAVDEYLEDREIATLLKAAGYNDFYSESTVNVYFDDFGKPKEFFLDQFKDEFESFDPRNTGYAEKLRSFFVHDGKRHFFISLGNRVQHEQTVKAMGAALEGIPFSLEILGSSKSVLIWFIFQFAAAAASLVISRDRFRFALQIPVILAFAWEGISGIFLAGILAGLWELCREPLGEVMNQRPFGSLKERLRPYRYSFMWILFFIIAFIAISGFGNVSPIPVLTGFLCFFLLEFLSFKEIKKKKSRNQAFTPVLIMTLPQKTNSFRFPILSFAVASLLSLLFFLFFPGYTPKITTKSPNDLANFPLRSEYDAHMAFQSSFFIVPFNDYHADSTSTKGFIGEPEYLSYFLGEDGFIAETENSFYPWEIPDFPLEELMEFLLDYENRVEDTPEPLLKDWIIVTVILACCIPGTQNVQIKTSKKNKAPVLRDRRAAA